MWKSCEHEIINAEHVRSFVVAFNFSPITERTGKRIAAADVWLMTEVKIASMNMTMIKTTQMLSDASDLEMMSAKRSKSPLRFIASPSAKPPPMRTSVDHLSAPKSSADNIPVLKKRMTGIRDVIPTCPRKNDKLSSSAQRILVITVIAHANVCFHVHGENSPSWLIWRTGSDGLNIKMRYNHVSVRRTMAVGHANPIHCMNEIDVVPLSLMYLIARMFCGDAIVVAMPPAFPLHARPRRSAVMNLSSGSRLLMIGSENVRTSVVDATFERNAAIQKLRSMTAKRTIFGFGEMCESKYALTLSVIDSFVRAADIVSEPRKTKMMGSMNFAANIVASCVEVILVPVVLS